MIAANVLKCPPEMEWMASCENEDIKGRLFAKSRLPFTSEMDRSEQGQSRSSTKSIVYILLYRYIDITKEVMPGSLPRSELQRRLASNILNNLLRWQTFN